jgi:sn-glycerol 3-phosphate transport system ATP-binding protein
MNLIRLNGVEDRRALTAAGGRIPDPEQTEGWRIGVRPEKIELGKQGLTASVVAIDFLGAETIVRLACGKQTLFVKVNGRTNFAPGDEVTVGWSPDAAHFFDENGLRIRS